jgi:hypothetical protein
MADEIILKHVEALVTIKHRAFCFLADVGLGCIDAA